MICPWQDRDRSFSWIKAIAFALLFVPPIWLVYEVDNGEFGPVPLGGLTYWSGLWATALLLAALAVTPLCTIFRWGNIILIRRMLGVTALVYTVAHILIYFALRFWDFSNIAHEMVTRLSLLVATASTIGLIALGVTSLDRAVERMGPAGWNRLHRTVYVTTALALVHYLLSPGSFPDQSFTTGVFVWLMAWRVLCRYRLGTDVTALVLLALTTTVFTAGFEVFWNWAYHDDEPAFTFGNNFSLILGVSPAWKMLVLGLAMAAGAAAMRMRAPRVGARAALRAKSS